MPDTSPLLNKQTASSQIMPVTIERTSWAASEAALRSIREAVFIREQRVPDSLEWDEHDQEAMHFLATTEDGTPVGCIRLLPSGQLSRLAVLEQFRKDRKSTRLNSSHVRISYAVFCLKKKKKQLK